MDILNQKEGDDNKKNDIRGDSPQISKAQKPHK
jgi:hypothetical protein